MAQSPAAEGSEGRAGNHQNINFAKRSTSATVLIHYLFLTYKRIRYLVINAK
jgi:hypothetical protein